MVATPRSVNPSPNEMSSASLIDDTESLALRFPFDGSIGEIQQKHFLLDVAKAQLSKNFKLYYRLRPFIPIWCRQILQRGRNQSIETSKNWYVPEDFIGDLRQAVETQDNQVQVHPWPDGHRMSSCLTHDVETKTGHDLVDQLATIEESYGFRSAWNFIPYHYNIDQGLLQDLKQRGHEIGVHGYNHDGRLFESKRTFNARIGPINQALFDMQSVGFRAPMVHRNLDWLQNLECDYDASCFDIDPFQAMPGGVGSPWPFIAGKLVELPYTLPQDHTLFLTLGESSARTWIDKLAYLRRISGMALLITHPDYLDTSSRLNVYREFLDHLTQQDSCWHVLPRQIAAWWRERNEIQTLHESGTTENFGRGRPFDVQQLLL